MADTLKQAATAALGYFDCGGTNIEAVREALRAALAAHPAPAADPAPEPPRQLTERQIGEAMCSVDNPLNWGYLKDHAEVVVQFTRAVERLLASPAAEQPEPKTANVHSTAEVATDAAHTAAQTGGHSYEASMLRNLLARIHGDGGHYVSEHGLDKALDDADTMVAEWRATAAQTEQDAARYRFLRAADHIAISPKAARDPVAYDAAIDAAMAATQGESA